MEGEQFTAEILAQIQGKGAQEVIRVLSQEIGKRHRLVVLPKVANKFGTQTFSNISFPPFPLPKVSLSAVRSGGKSSLAREKVGATLEAFYHQDLVKSPEVTHQLARHFDLAGLSR